MPAVSEFLLKAIMKYFNVPSSKVLYMHIFRLEYILT